MADFRVTASESLAYLRDQQVDLPRWMTLIAFHVEHSSVDTNLRLELNAASAEIP